MEMTKVNCPHYECEANEDGVCSLKEVFFAQDSYNQFICLQKFETSERAQGYIPSWETLKKE